MILLLCGTQNRQVYRDRKQKTDYQGLGGRGLDSSCLLGTEFVSEKMKKFWRRVVTATQQCECTHCQCTVHLDMVKIAHFMLCIFYHIFFKKERKGNLRPKQTVINLTEWSARLNFSLFNPPTFPLTEDAFHILSTIPELSLPK